MHLPEQPTMNNTAHGHGDKGMAFYTYEDAQGLGVLLDVRRSHGRAPFIETWRYRWLPEATFGYYSELRQAVEALTEEQEAAERAKWPQMPLPPHPRTGPGNSRCWLHTDRPATHMGRVRTSWHLHDGTRAMLCGECATAAAADPAVIVRASDARKAYVASLPPIGERLGAQQ